MKARPTASHLRFLKALFMFFIVQVYQELWKKSFQSSGNFDILTKRVYFICMAPTPTGRLLVLLLFYAGMFPAFSQSTPNLQPQVFVIQSYSSDYVWDASWKKGLEAVLGKRAVLKYFEMNTKKLPAERHQDQARKAFVEYNRIQPDLVILADDAAVKLVGPLLVNKPVPVVYIGVNNNPRNYFPSLPDNFTGILERPLLKRNLVYLKDIMPSATRALILFDTDITSRIILDDFFYGKPDLDIGGITTSIRLVGERREWERLVREAQGRYDFIVLGLYQTLRSEDGTNVDPEALARWTSQNSRIPVFGFWEFSITKDTAVGGLVLYGEDMGVRAGNLAARILDGEDVRKIPPEVNNQGILLFSRSQLARWKLTIPPPLLREARFVD